MKIKSIAGGLLAAAVCFTPAISQADNEIPQAILDACRALAEAQDPVPDPNCKSQCVAAIHVCNDEQTGLVIEPIQDRCARKVNKALDACI